MMRQRNNFLIMLYFIVLSRGDDRVELENLKTHKKICGTLPSSDAVVFDGDESAVMYKITRILPAGYKLSMFSDGTYPFVIDGDRKILYDITAELVPLADIDQLEEYSLIEVE